MAGLLLLLLIPLSPLRSTPLRVRFVQQKEAPQELFFVFWQRLADAADQLGAHRASYG